MILVWELIGTSFFFKLTRVGDREFDVGEKILLVALGCGRLPGILEVTAKHSLVVFGTMGGEVLADLAPRIGGSMGSSIPVYFYETG